MKQCTTHSFACDCREEKFRKIEKENEILLKTVEHYASEWNQINPRKACEALEKLEQLNKEN